MQYFDEDDLDDDDYVIILSKEGKLKSIIVPELDEADMEMATPENILRLIEFLSTAEFSDKHRTYH
jgi:hypothetical protein